jgi:murein DD-endopeptidase MepM/ murein hydrolase activator NlpD
MANVEFQKLFGLESREAVLETMNPSDSGDIDMAILKKQIDKTIDAVGEIRDYLSEQRDLYMATPMGLPSKGWLSSGYGYRMHPVRGVRHLHDGVDISARPGTTVRATADGIVSFAGRSGANGNLVALEHGFGYSTYYAHNKKLNVKIGQVVKRGDVIAYVGSTGSSTGPHVHYEIWKNRKSVNPRPYLKGGRW